MNAFTVLAYDYPVLGAFWTIMWIALWVLWLVLVVRVVVDIFRDDSLHGGKKAGWLLFVIVLPFLGVFVYLIARGKGMGSREARHAREQRDAFEAQLREMTGGGDGHVQELSRLSALKDSGDLTEGEFTRAKEKLLR
jgi:phospholipase D-like protein